jgi:hypothetical protein
MIPMPSPEPKIVDLVNQWTGYGIDEGVELRTVRSAGLPAGRPLGAGGICHSACNIDLCLS